MNVPKTLDVYQQHHMAMPYGDIVAQKYKSVYLPFQPSGMYQPRLGSSYYFNPDHELDAGKAIIKGIEVVNVTAAQSNLAPGGRRDNPSSTQLDRMLLYISNTQREVIATFPLWDLIRSENNGKLLFTYFTTQIWQNCYVEFTAATGLTGDNGLQFIVYYDQV